MGTDWVAPRRASQALRRPNKARPTRHDPADAPPERRDPDLPVASERLRLSKPRTPGDRAANLRRIDGAPAWHPHDRGAAASGPPLHHPLQGVRPVPAWTEFSLAP